MIPEDPLGNVNQLSALDQDSDSDVTDLQALALQEVGPHQCFGTGYFLNYKLTLRPAAQLDAPQVYIFFHGMPERFLLLQLIYVVFYSFYTIKIGD